MILMGDNSAFGGQEVALSKSRRVLPTVADASLPPLGTRGLLPVLTRRKDVSDRAAYAFAVDAGAPGLDEAVQRAYEETLEHAKHGQLGWLSFCAGASMSQEVPSVEGGPVGDGALEAGDLPGAADPDGVTGAFGAPRETEEPGAGTSGEVAGHVSLDVGLLALLDAAALVNVVLDEAYEQTGYPFGVLDALQVQVTDSGSGFCRMEPLAASSLAGADLGPLALCLETYEKVGSPDSLSAQVLFFPGGAPRKVVLTSQETSSHACRVVARREPWGTVRVSEVVETFGKKVPPRVLLGEDHARSAGRGREGRDIRDGRDRRLAQGR